MKAKELIKEIQSRAAAPEITCDTIKSGDENKEIHKVAVAMFPTIKLIKEVSEWGADMLLIHEPTYYNHLEAGPQTALVKAKKELIEKSGLVIYRHHDRMHAEDPDGIAEGELHYLGLRGKVKKTPHFASYVLTLDEEMSPLEIARLFEDKLGVKKVRIAGNVTEKIKNVALCFGSPGGIFELISDDGVDAMLIGEVCEWQICEYARDSTELGINKSVLAIGHIGSERDGMRLMCERLKSSHPEIEFKYFECGEVYSYTEEYK